MRKVFAGIAAAAGAQRETPEQRQVLLGKTFPRYAIALHAGQRQEKILVVQLLKLGEAPRARDRFAILAPAHGVPTMLTMAGSQDLLGTGTE